MGSWWAESGRGQHALHPVFVRLVDKSARGKSALGLGGLFGQDVTLEGVLPLHFSGASRFEAFLGTGVRFHFRHGGIMLR